MHIQSISIKGFRNFHDSKISFHKGLNVIIGSNNSGKTNLLIAIQQIREPKNLTFFDLCMHSLEESYRDKSFLKEPTSVTLMFDIAHEIDLEEIPVDESLLKLSDFLILSDELIADEYVSSFPINALVKMEYGIRQTRLNDYRREAANIKDEEDYLRLVKSWIHEYEWSFVNGSTMRPVKPSVAKRIFEIEYVQADRSDPLLDASSADLYKIMFAKQPLNENHIATSIQDLVEEMADEQITEMSKVIQKDYERIGISKGNVEIRPSVEYNHKISQLFGLGIRDSLGQFELPFENNGLGYNNLISIYLILLCRDCLNPQIHSMVLLEEPEAHLHPAMQYKLFKYINELQSRDELRQQVFVTTHSSNITAVTSIDGIIDLHYDRKRKPNNVDSINFSDIFDSKNQNSKNHIQKFLDVTRSDMLFADQVVLVEGLTEKLLIPIFMKNEGLDVDDNHISVVETGGKMINHFVHLFAEERKTKLLCITDCDYSWIVADTINSIPYKGHEVTHVDDLKWVTESNPYVWITYQRDQDMGATFEDQLMLDNWQNDEEVRKTLLRFVLPETLIKFLDDHELSMSAWMEHIDDIQGNTRRKVKRILDPFHAAFTDKSSKELYCWEALFFANLFRVYADSQKGNLALSILTDEDLCAKVKTPRYIKEGIEWLKN